MFDLLLSFLAHPLESFLGVVWSWLLLYEKTFFTFLLVSTLSDLSKYVSLGELGLTLDLTLYSSVAALVLSLARY